MKYTLTGKGMRHESDDVESVLETARVWLLNGKDVAITVEIPEHLRPESCFVCGTPAESHTATTGHDFWSNADAAVAFRREPQGETNPEAAYVEQHRPY